MAETNVTTRSPTGPDSSNWKGGRVTDPRGYVLLRVGKDHHLADIRGYAYEHRVLAEKKIGRQLKKGEQVHHVNEDPGDNRPENLHVFGSIAEHRVAHRKSGKTRRLPGEDNSTVPCACGCGSTFLRFDRWGRPRKIVSGHNGRRSPVGRFF